ncbi:MAG TPA: YdeI/OmpD-associated family protein [Rudaea sp.]|nr:YdeI/OmpD-associated family protein [Rudaea sp.]
MATRDPRVDAYIANAPDFAKPILVHLRELVHRNCPQVEETLKWRMPTFMHHGMLAGMAAFRQHCSFGFWKHELVVGKELAGSPQGMGQFGKVTKISELPSASALAAYIKRAMKLNEEGVKAPRATPKKRALTMPPDLAAALKKNRRAAAAFAAFSPSNQREYIEWLVEAKRDETRARRLSQAIEWIAEGKPRNWKYMNC